MYLTKKERKQFSFIYISMRKKYPNWAHKQIVYGAMHIIKTQRGAKYE